MLNESALRALEQPLTPEEVSGLKASSQAKRERNSTHASLCKNIEFAKNLWVKHILQLWHEKLGTPTKKVHVEPKGS